LGTLEPEDSIREVVADRISAVFRHFESLTTLSTGRSVGRKIGVAQEFMLKKYLEQEERLRRRMYLEQLLSGKSGASHKVEFSWHPLTSHALRVGDDIPGLDGVSIASANDSTETVKLTGPWGGRGAPCRRGTAIPKRSPLSSVLSSQNLDLRVVSVDGDEIELDIVDRSRLLASLESKRVGAQRFAGSDKLGSGIQTIEKAKQASLVAIDLDLLHNGSVKPLETETAKPKQLISVVALGNGVHWTDKDKAILGTYVDFTFLVKDEGIIRYAEYVRELADEEEDALEAFMSYFKGLTKQEDDDFEVGDGDFAVIAPTGEERSLRQVLVDHIEQVDV
jgi:hypothetical protein